MQAVRLVRQALALSMIAALPLKGQTATFEGIANTFGVPNGTAGVNWSNWFALDPVTYYGGSRGASLSRCATSGTVCAYNGGGGLATISSASPFNLVSGNFTTFYNAGLGGFDQPITVTVNAFFNAVLVGTQTLNLDALGATTYDFDFQHVTRVTFDTHSAGFNDKLFLADDLVFGEAIVAPVPEPASMALLGTGLVGLFGAARRRRQMAV